MANANGKSLKGDCECCPNTNVQLYIRHGNMAMCEECAKKEDSLVKSAKHIIEVSQKIDTTIEVKADIYNAQTVSLTELRGAIWADVSITDSDKEYTYAKETQKRLLHIQKVIFDSKIAERVLQTELQQSVSRQTEARRAEFKNFDVNYRPTTITKKEKTTKPAKQGKKSFNKQELNDACKKYGVPASGVQSIVISRNMSYDAAAKHLAGLMGLPTAGK
jgi:hypothetical protein